MAGRHCSCEQCPHEWASQPASQPNTAQICCQYWSFDQAPKIFEDYIVHAHNLRFVKSFRRTTTRDLGRMFNECHDMLKNSMLSAASSIALTSDIWSGNGKEDYISVVAHYVNVDWELQKKLIGLRLIEVKHSGENITERVVAGCGLGVWSD